MIMSKIKVGSLALSLSMKFIDENICW